MATQSRRRRAELPVTAARSPRLPWPARAGFAVGATRRQRQTQYRQQINALWGVLAVTLVLSLLFIWANWRNGGAARSVSCQEFPLFCLPLAGGSPDREQLESADARTLDAASSGSPGVVRYVDANNVATLGNPDAPVHFVTVSDFACPHCQTFHATDVPRFIEDFVLTGQATFGFVMTTGTGGAYSEMASQAALCAGEQGAFWEMSDEMFRLARSQGLDTAFSLKQIRDSASAMGLDSQRITDCVTSNRYASFLRQHRTFAIDNGVTGTPTVLVSYGRTNQWTIVPRDYESLKRLTEAATRN